MTVLSRLCYDWAVRAFGRPHVHNRPVRAMRLAEEAIELAQCVEVDKEILHKLIDVIYTRPVGNVSQELGGIAVTFNVMCESLGLDPDLILEMELNRCLSRSPEHFAARNQEKINMGFTDAP